MVKTHAITAATACNCNSNCMQLQHVATAAPACIYSSSRTQLQHQVEQLMSSSDTRTVLTKTTFLVQKKSQKSRNNNFTITYCLQIQQALLDYSTVL